MPSLSEARPPGAARPLSVAEQQTVLQYAREAIIEAVCRGELPRVLRHDGIFAQRCGVFVTLHVSQRLRGCIGVIATPAEHSEPAPNSGSSRMPPWSVEVGPWKERSEPESRDTREPTHAIEPLGQSLVRCAASAALSDPRFLPVRPDEIPDLRIEISLLSAPEPIRPEQIEIGRHGLLVVGGSSFASKDESNTNPAGDPPLALKGGSVKRGLLLPQVAVEHHLTAEQFLAETCRKAGLPPDDWRNDSSFADTCRVKLFAFTCQVFSEPEKPSTVGS